MVWVIQCIYVHIHLASEYCRYGLFQKKNQTGWVEDIRFSKRPGIFHFCTFSLEIPDKAKFHPWKFLEIVLELRFLGNLKTKNQDPWKFCINFSSSSLEIHLRSYWTLEIISHAIWYPWKFHILNPSVCLFFWIAHYTLSHWMISLFRRVTLK